MLIHEFISISNENIPNGIVEYSLIKNDELVKHKIDFSDSVILKYHELFFNGFYSEWNKQGNKHIGLNYYGITIIKCNNIGCFLLTLRQLPKRTQRRKDVCALKKMLKDAKEQDLDIIHFGI